MTSKSIIAQLVTLIIIATFPLCNVPADDLTLLSGMTTTYWAQAMFMCGRRILMVSIEILNDK